MEFGEYNRINFTFAPELNTTISKVIEFEGSLTPVISSGIEEVFNEIEKFINYHCMVIHPDSNNGFISFPDEETYNKFLQFYKSNEELFNGIDFDF